MKALVIRVRLDRSEAKEATAEHIADAKRMIAADREAAKLAREAEKQLAAEKKAIAKQEAADKKAIDKQAAADKRASDKQTADEAKKNADKSLSDTEVAEKAKARIVAEQNKKRVNAAVEAHEAESEGSKKSGFSIESVSSALTGLVSGYATFGKVAEVVSMVNSMWAAQRKDIEDSVDAITHYREDVLELAALKGKFGQSTPELGKQLAFRSHTLQSQGDALALQEGAMNTGQAAMGGGFISEDSFLGTAKDPGLIHHVGSFQAANPKLDANALGNLAGTLPSMIGTQNQDPKEVARRIFGISNILQAGSSSASSGIGQFQKNSGLVQPGMFSSPEQLAAVQSTLSLSSPDEAGTLTKQFLRGTVGGLSRMRGSAIEGTEKQGQYLAGIGATNQMDAPAIGKLIAADLKAQEAKEAANGRMFNSMDYLAHKGYEDQETRMAVSDFAKRVNSGQYAKTFEPMANPGAAPSFDASMAPVNQFKAIDPVATARKSELAKNMSDAALTVGAPEEYLNQKRMAFYKLRATREHGVSGDFDPTNESTVWKGPVLDEMQDDVFERAKKAGVDMSEFMEAAPKGIVETFRYGQRNALRNSQGLAGLGSGGGILGGSLDSRGKYTDAERTDAYYRANAKIKAAGGEAPNNSKLEAIMQKQVDIAQRTEDLIRNGNAKAPPPNLKVAPPQGPRR